MLNKENMTRKKGATKIPVAIERRDPLRSLSQGNQQEPGPSEQEKRHQNTGDKDSAKISHQKHQNDECQAGPSGACPNGARSKRQDPKTYRESDTRHPGALPDMRHVTMFRGNLEQSEIQLSAEESKLIQDMKDIYNFESVPEELNRAIASTPRPEQLDEGQNTPRTVKPDQGKSTQKKIKRSLKRPHTKDLQGSPALKIKKENAPKSQRPVCVGYNWPPVYDQDYLFENLNYMLQIEKQSRINSTIGRACRSCIVNWIINVNGSAGNPAVVELSCWYLNAYLDKATVPLEKLQLVAAACYWIAAKINGVAVTSTRLERWSGFAFSIAHLTAMEMKVLTALHFPRMAPVPHDFMPYLCCWCEETSGILAASATFISLCVALVQRPGSECPPSVLACACVRSALRLTGYNTIIPRLEACPVYKTAVNKTRDFRSVCQMARNAVRMVSSQNFEYKAPMNKFSGPPHYVANRIAMAARTHREDIV